MVIHHMPGYDEATKEITRRFAAHGYLAVCPNLYSARRREPAPTMRPRSPGRTGACPTSGWSATSPAPPPLKSLASSQRPGRHHRLLLGRPPVVPGRLQPPLDAAVDCYGAFVVGTPPEGIAAQDRPDRAPGRPTSPARCSASSGPRTSTPRPSRSPSWSRRSKRAGKTFEFHTYEGAGHAFFATDRPSYRPEAANDGWERIWDFFGRYLAPARSEGAAVCTYQTENSRSADPARDRRLVPALGATVYFDHPAHYPAEHSLNIDFLNLGGPTRPARVAVEPIRVSAGLPELGRRT